MPAPSPSTPPDAVTVIGIGADGWPGLSEAVQRRVAAAATVVGAPRQLALLPPMPGQTRTEWGRPFDVGVVLDLVDRTAGEVVVLASGDPMLSGVGTLLAARHPGLEIVPAVSSVSLARARLGWDALTTEVVSVVGRRLDRVRRHLSPGSRLLVLSADETTPAALADLLDDAGFGASRVVVLGELGGEHETVAELGTELGTADPPRLNLVAIECRSDPGSDRPGPWVGSRAPGLPDDAYEHDGQLTKRDLRAAALARLMPQPHQLLWDVGAGAGSIGIEWMRAHPTCRALAVEADADRCARIARNAARLGVPDLEVRHGRAPAALTDRPEPHAVFVGGGATEPGLLAVCRARLADGGRLVVHAVTLESERLLADAHAEHGGELTRHAVEHAEPLGGLRGWRPARAVTQWCWTKPGHPR